jgi:hypothetical protein
MPYYRPPTMLETARELLTIKDLAIFLAKKRTLISEYRLAKVPILVLPGLSTTDHFTAPLRNLLNEAGGIAYGWGLGYNHGNINRLFPQVEKTAVQLAQKHRSPLIIIGWSLGGYLAREIVRKNPSLAIRVITMGTPVTGPRYTVTAARYNRSRISVRMIERQIEKREQVRIAVPVLAMFSRNDGIVHWKSCLSPHEPMVRDVEVNSLHMSMPYSIEVAENILNELSEYR